MTHTYMQANNIALVQPCISGEKESLRDFYKVVLLSLFTQSKFFCAIVWFMDVHF